MISLKRLLAYSMVIGSIFLVVGCSSGSNGPVSSATGELPARTPDLLGQVKQVRGNRLTVFKAEMTGPELTEEEKSKRREMMMQLSPEERAKARAERVKITDETLDLTIPVGVPIVSIENAGGKTGTENLNLSDIKQGDFLRFWFAGGSSDEIIYVQLNKF